MIDGYEKHTCTECDTMFTSNEELKQHHSIDHGLVIENTIEWSDIQPEQKIEETDDGFKADGKDVTFSDEDSTYAKEYLSDIAKLQRVQVASEQRLKMARDEIIASEADTNAFYEQFLGESNGQDFSSGAGTINPLDTPKFKYSKDNKLADTINTKGYNPNPNAGLYDNKEFKEGGNHLEDPLAKEDFEVSFYGGEAKASEVNGDYIVNGMVIGKVTDFEPNNWFGKVELFSMPEFAEYGDLDPQAVVKGDDGVTYKSPRSGHGTLFDDDGNPTVDVTSFESKATEDSLIKIEDNEDEDTKVTVLDEWKNETDPSVGGDVKGIDQDELGEFGDYEVKCDACDGKGYELEWSGSNQEYFEDQCDACGGKGTITWTSTVGGDESLKSDWDESNYEEKYAWLKDLGVEDGYKYANLTLYELPEQIWKLVNEDYVQGFKQLVAESYKPDQKDTVETAEEKIISRKLDNVPVGQIARELVLWDNMSEDEAEKMVSETEPSDNDMSAKSLFNKKYSELNENELEEMELYDV